MCDYCETSFPLGTICAISGGRTFTGRLWVYADQLVVTVVDEDAGTGDVDYSFKSNPVRIDYCPVCGRELSTVA